MKQSLFMKLVLAVCLCFVVAFTFIACKDKEIYAGSDDFQSYPDYWNDFNDDSGDIYIPNHQGSTSQGDNDGSSSNDSSNDTSSEDFTANFTDDEEEQNSSSTVDTDKDGTPDEVDPDDDNDGVTDDKDDDDDGDGTPDDEENKHGNQGPLVFF